MFSAQMFRCFSGCSATCCVVALKLASQRVVVDAIDGYLIFDFHRFFWNERRSGGGGVSSRGAYKYITQNSVCLLNIISAQMGIPKSFISLEETIYFLG
ncbi:hypothetical protein CEXT_330691 [Caerostris extrusa]|uniref:Secreted protein n=1 Tax=Caerostris extrusa TaxID=172846 RepID=A0AAV4STJ2_CAEEX|nr:hypothetical protein CEXT_330691 [Caerostris extrusa]